MAWATSTARKSPFSFRTTSCPLLRTRHALDHGSFFPGNRVKCSTTPRKQGSEMQPWSGSRYRLDSAITILTSRLLLSPLMLRQKSSLFNGFKLHNGSISGGVRVPRAFSLGLRFLLPPTTPGAAVAAKRALLRTGGIPSDPAAPPPADGAAGAQDAAGRTGRQKKTRLPSRRGALPVTEEGGDWAEL